MTRRISWATVVLVGVLLSGCSSDDVTVPTTLVPVTTGSSTAVSTPTTPVSSISMSTTPATSVSSESTSDSAPESSTSPFASTAPLPADLDDAQQQAAVGAMDAYSTVWQLLDASQSAPLQDWAAQFAAVATPAFAAGQIEYLALLVKDGRRQLGSTSLTITTLTVDANTVTVQGCVGGDVRIVGADGSVVYDLTSDGATQTALIVRQDDGSWKVDQLLNPDQVQPC